jgi:hypothetical protein
MRSIFVFGSNLAGIHGAGSAKEAAKNHGAKQGYGIGLQGNSYGIPTKSGSLDILPLWTIEKYVAGFIEFAHQQKRHLVFDVVAIGCGLAGYRPYQVAPLFSPCMAFENVNLPKEFNQILWNLHTNYKD